MGKQHTQTRVRNRIHILGMEKLENYVSPKNTNSHASSTSNKASPEMDIEIIETISIDGHQEPTPRSPTPRTVPTDPGLSDSSSSFNNNQSKSKTSSRIPPKSLSKLSPKNRKISERRKRRQ